MFAPLVDFVTGRSSAWKAKYQAAFVTLVNPDTGVPYTAGGGGSGLADLLYIDDTNTVFVYRDTGSGVLTAVNVPAGTAYTVGANPRPWSPTTQAVTNSGTFAVQSTLQAGTNAIGSIIGQRPFAAAVTITRPANTTAYAVNAVLSTATSALTAFPTFALGIGNSIRASINNITLISSNGAASTRGQFAVYLFNSASPSGGGFNDAAAFAPTAAALATTTNELVGVMPSSTPMGTAAYGYILTNDTRQVVTDASGNVYLAIVLQNAYTPASGETITVVVSGTY